MSSNNETIVANDLSDSFGLVGGTAGGDAQNEQPWHRLPQSFMPKPRQILVLPSGLTSNRSTILETETTTVTDPRRPRVAQGNLHDRGAAGLESAAVTYGLRPACGAISFAHEPPAR